ncbi:MAG TPA: response regulator transcription factor [Lentimicrobium sp.]|nr:response regulator transcription factor [Lentimicrobium sp.]
MKINCIAVDDEPLALDIVKDYCNKIPFLELLRTFDNAIDTLEYLNSNKVDLIFLDIQMEELNGIQFLNTLKDKPYVILTTAFDNYALQGFELDVSDYLMKPFSFERFLKSVNKIYDRLKSGQSGQVITQTNQSTKPIGKNFFFVKTETRIEKIKSDEVLYVEGMGDYWRIVTKNKRIMTLMNAHGIADIMEEPFFCRVHKSYFVAIDKIDFVERKHIRIGDQVIPISDTYEKNFFEIIERNK